MDCSLNMLCLFCVLKKIKTESFTGCIQGKIFLTIFDNYQLLTSITLTYVILEKQWDVTTYWFLFYKREKKKMQWRQREDFKKYSMKICCNVEYHSCSSIIKIQMNKTQRNNDFRFHIQALAYQFPKENLLFSTFISATQFSYLIGPTGMQ